MAIKKTIGFVASAILLIPAMAFADHNRGEREAEIRARYDWVVLDGEFSAANVAAYALESYFAGGEITQATLKECAQKMGRDVAGEMVRNGFDPNRDRIYSGLMVFNNWQDLPFGQQLPLPNKFVPYVGVRRQHLPIDLDRWCKAKYGPRAAAIVRQHNAYGWACVVNGQDFPINVGEAAQMQYGPAKRVAFKDWNDPYSWYAY